MMHLQEMYFRKSAILPQKLSVSGVLFLSNEIEYDIYNDINCVGTQYS